MAGINPNLGNLKLQNLQLSKTAEVNTQEAKGKEVGGAKPSAVFVNADSAPILQGDYDGCRLGDVWIYLDPHGNALYSRLTLNAQGERVWIEIDATDVQERDYEKDRGNIRRY